MDAIKTDDSRTYWFDINNKKIANEEAMLSKLLDDDVLFCNSRKYVDFDNKTIMDETIVLIVNCNDVFAWGCADGESFTIDELPNLFELYIKNPKCGAIQWVCIKRNEKPQTPIIRYLKDNGGWDEKLESLPENQYDKICKEEMVKKNNKLV